MPEQQPTPVTTPTARDYINYHTDYDTVRKSLFLGREMGLLENMRNEFPLVWDQYKHLKSLDWEETEINIDSCKNEFNTLPTEVTELMINTLAFQFEADSSAAHIGRLMYPFVTNTELTAYLTELSKNECLTPDHEVLTPDGWVGIDQITTEDKVAQWDHETRKVSFVKPTQVFEKDYKGKMFHFTSIAGNIDQLVTPNHRMPILTSYCGNARKEWDFAENVMYHGGNAMPTAGYITTPGRPMTPQERLYLAVQADGALCSDTYTGERSSRLSYQFGLKKERKIARLMYLAGLANWELREGDAVREDGCRTFRLYAPVAEYNKEAKTFDWIKLDQISQQWCLDFLNEICQWDGNITSNERGRYITGVKADLDKVSAIAHMANHRAYVTVIPARENVPMPGGTLSNTKEAYQVHFTDRDYVVGNSIVKTEVDYEGKVHCLTVPSSYFMVRRNNAVSVSGNCLHALAYKFIVESSFENPQLFLKRVMSIQETFQRLEAVKAVFTDIFHLGLEYQRGTVVDEKVLRKAILKFWVTLFCLERIQFISSFAITFGLAEKGYFVPIAKLVQKIATDEFQIHVQTDKIILKNELAIPEVFSLYLEILPEIEQIIQEVEAAELSWLRGFLFKDNAVIAGIQCEKIEQFVVYSSSEVYEFFGLKSPHGQITENPLPYMNKWLVIDNNQASPQEENVANYLLGRYQDDTGEFDMAKYRTMFQTTS
jgi:ribonucleotide reductase beta subunit family protein with ferritin-like domain